MQPVTTFALREVMRYGANEPTSDFVEGRERRLGGDVLADVPAVARDSSGTLYVLDRDWKKVVAFGLDGRLEDVILGGAGEGPGEFSLPVHLTLTMSGAVSVLDWDLKRVTWFDRGQLVNIVRLPSLSIRRHVVLGDTIVVTQVRASDAPIVQMYSPDGELMDEGPALALEDQAYGPAAALTSGAPDVLLVSSRQPGVWMERRSNQWRRVGSPLFPDQTPPFEEVTGPRMTRVTPAQADASSIAIYRDSLVLQGYHRFRQPVSREDPRSQNTLDRFIAVFDMRGRPVGTVQLPLGVDVECLYVDPFTDHILLCSAERFPQVVEYELQW